MHATRINGRNYVSKDGHWIPVPTHILGYSKDGRRYLRDWRAWVTGERNEEPAPRDYVPARSGTKSGPITSIHRRIRT